MNLKTMFLSVTIGTLLISLANVRPAYSGEFSNYSRILFQQASTWVPANNVCLSGDLLLHKKKDYIEKVRCTGKDSDNCSIWSTKPLIQSLDSVRARCTKYVESECLRFTNVNFDQSPQVKVEIYQNKFDFIDNQEPIRVDWHKITDCK